MGRVFVRWFAIILSLACVGCQDNRSELEKLLYPDGTPPGVTFEPATDESLDDAPPNDHGRRFLQQLIDAAQESDRIVAVEHSYIFDGADPSSRLSPERSYRRVVLSASERSSLVSALKSTNPNVGDWESACIFEPHHRLEFHKGSKKLHVLEVCFQCGQLELNGSQPSEPQAIFASLGKFLTDIGMAPERDWASLARNGPQSDNSFKPTPLRGPN